METSDQEVKQVKKKQLPKAAEPYKFKPGKSGNPGGRPKSKHISEALNKALASGKADELAAVLLKLAKKGSVAAIREVADRTEGKPNQQVTVDGNIAIDLTARRERIRSLLTGILGKSEQ